MKCTNRKCYPATPLKRLNWGNRELVEIYSTFSNEQCTRQFHSSVGVLTTIWWVIFPCRGRYILSFLCSVLWIVILSFAMVTLVGRTGCILGVGEFVMGLVIVAIGTSVPVSCTCRILFIHFRSFFSPFNHQKSLIDNKLLFIGSHHIERLKKLTQDHSNKQLVWFSLLANTGFYRVFQLERCCKII